jgi:hypothetical protein
VHFDKTRHENFYRSNLEADILQKLLTEEQWRKFACYSYTTVLLREKWTFLQCRKQAY